MGIASNVGLWGCLVIAIREAILRTRTYLRRRKGLCVKCVYILALGGTAICPECGDATKFQEGDSTAGS